jgi:hypothetical protein
VLNETREHGADAAKHGVNAELIYSNFPLAARLQESLYADESAKSALMAELMMALTVEN